MTKMIFAIFGVASYFIFFATFLYLIAFMMNLSALPLTIDVGPEMEAGSAIATNIGLIAVFGIQHSVMARPGFKAAWTKIVPEPVERSVYVLFSSVVLWLFFLYWAPMPAVIWQVENGMAVNAIWALFAAGWLTVLLSTFLISHFELFGLKQVYQNMVGGKAPEPKLQKPLFYKIVRHPLYLGFLIAFWATPVMTYGHLLFAVGMTIYIMIAIHYEEKDLTSTFGKEYEDYKGEVGKILPGIGKV